MNELNEFRYMQIYYSDEHIIAHFDKKCKIAMDDSGVFSQT